MENGYWWCRRKKQRSGVLLTVGTRPDGRPDERWCFRVEEVNWAAWEQMLPTVCEDPTGEGIPGKVFYVVQAGLQLATILLLQPPKCWDDRHHEESWTDHSTRGRAFLTGSPPAPPGAPVPLMVRHSRNLSSHTC
ncbi:transient receptor potential cation channel subfamily V member 2-like isoform X1 [Heterocephalus glaber]|uniref:Transient receptor potential cation channel subfamily V member 2-like isoform X1 n=1 Tax=Heterocephalus glaber TaxID=10181 RepID=A0AAX6SE99_HETGA|nr:transient receptor potential cation channel subfamily V member 2-like isoform X1 [Heterocephalus glaber]